MSTIASTLKINPGLWLLLKMNSRGALRKLVRSLFTLHGAIVSLVVIGYSYFIHALGHDKAAFVDLQSYLTHHGGLVLFFFFLTTVESGLSARGIYFTQPEAQLILTAPVTRQELLTYHILKKLPVAVALPAFLTFLLAPEDIFGVYIRIVSSILVLHSLPLAVTCAFQPLPLRSHQILRKFVHTLTYTTLICMGALLYWRQEHAILRVLDSDQLHMALFPFYWANSLLFQTSLSSTILWLAVTGGTALFSLLFASKHLEIGNDKMNMLHEELTKKLERFQKSGIATSRVRMFEFAVPDFPSLEGIGPLIWRRCQELSRRLPHLIALFIFGLAYQAWIVSMLLQKAANSGKGYIGLAELNDSSHILAIIVALIVAGFDFKADTHRLEWLKTLPIKPGRAVIAQLALSSLYQAIFICSLFLLNHVMYSHYFPQKHLPASSFVSLLLSLPLGILYISAANALYLLVPNYGTERRAASSFFQYLCGIALAVGMIAFVFYMFHVCGMVAKQMTGGNLAFVFISTFAFSLAAAMALGIVIWAYDRFDVSRVSR